MSKMLYLYLIFKHEKRSALVGVVLICNASLKEPAETRKTF